MRKFVRTILVLTSVSFFQSVVSAGTLTVIGSGTFSSTAPNTIWSAPSSAWSFSFIVPEIPSVSNTDPFGFDITFSNFMYHLGTASVVTTPTRIRFFTTALGGLLNINFVDTSAPPDGDPVTGFEFGGAQAFSGLTANPTILTDAYPASAQFFSAGGLADAFSGTVNITPAASSTLEPATLGMTAAACCFFGWIRRRQGTA